MGSCRGICAFEKEHVFFIKNKFNKHFLLDLQVKQLKERLLNSNLFKDSFWAVFGNGAGNALLLLAGIIIARFLGKDLYGEYGVVKTTMFYVASFATFGLGFTSTKFIASSIQEHPFHVKNIIQDALWITLSFSVSVALVLFVFAPQIADYLEEPKLVLSFRALSIVIVFKALSTTQIGILSGAKKFKEVARNNLCAGFSLLVLSVPLTYLGGLRGSLLALLLSQAFNVLVNCLSIRKIEAMYERQENFSYKKKLLQFSLPVALQESSFAFSHWMAIMLLTKLSSMGELGLYSASSQWSTIVYMIPSLLGNVVLSHLSSTVSDGNAHQSTMRKIIMVNLLCTFVPFVFVYFMAGFISSFYGTSFAGMPSVLRILTFATIFDACSTVFRSELMAQGRPWTLFVIRLIRDLLLVILVYVLLTIGKGENGAIFYSWSVVSVSVISFFLSLGACKMSPFNSPTN